MKTRCIQLTVYSLILAFSPCALAMDYSVFSNQKLLELRGAVGTASVEEREAYRHEWEKRLQNMDSAERKLYEKALQEEEDTVDGDGKGKESIIIQGRGYDKGEGAVIFGGGPGKPPGKGGSR